MKSNEDYKIYTQNPKIHEIINAFFPLSKKNKKNSKSSRNGFDLSCENGISFILNIALPIQIRINTIAMDEDKLVVGAFVYLFVFLSIFLSWKISMNMYETQVSYAWIEKLFRIQNILYRPLQKIFHIRCKCNVNMD